jgi:predicted O-methyltransferase YrrM
LRVLEIGIADGLSTIPFAVNLQLLAVPFVYEAIDIEVKNNVRELQNSILGLTPELAHPDRLHHLHLIEENSLAYLSQRQEALQSEPNGKLDIILIDGDHNYETVKRECELLKYAIYENTILIFDDYNNRHALVDTYYADLEGYENNPLATPSKKSDGPAGVRAAVDEFIKEMGYTGVSFPGLGPMMVSPSPQHTSMLKTFRKTVVKGFERATEEKN